MTAATLRTGAAAWHIAGRCRVGRDSRRGSGGSGGVGTDRGSGFFARSRHPRDCSTTSAASAASAASSGRGRGTGGGRGGGGAAESGREYISESISPGLYLRDYISAVAQLRATRQNSLTTARHPSTGAPKSVTTFLIWQVHTDRWLLSEVVGYASRSRGTYDLGEVDL
jgi:hypothetical protein